MPNEVRLRDAVDFILHAADERGLRIVGRALQQRQAGAAQTSTESAPANPRLDLAQSISQRVAQQLSQAVDASAMTRDVVRRLILQNEPDLTPAHLDVLLDAWTPSASAGEAAASGDAKGGAEPARGAEDSLPAAAVMAMVTQFVSYSLGIMPAHEQRDLPGGWSTRYWAVFSARTQTLIKQLLTGSIEAAEFWQGVRDQIGPVDASQSSSAAPAPADPAATLPA